jgi:hypothetical protein
MKRQHQRWRLFIDRPIQGALLLRALAYWAVCLLTQQLIVFLFVVITSSSDDFQVNGARVLWHIQVSMAASLAILPMILLDALKLSHRWVGPIFRLRATLHALTHGEGVAPIQFREGDFWHDLARDMNVVTAELHRHRAGERQKGPAANSPISPVALPAANTQAAACCVSTPGSSSPAAGVLGSYPGHSDLTAPSPSVPI